MSVDDVVDCHCIYCSVRGGRIELCDLDPGDLQPLSEDTVNSYSASLLSLPSKYNMKYPFESA